MKKIRFELLLVLLVALWGLSFSLTKPLLNKLGVFNFLTYRFLVGGLVVILILLITKSFKINKKLLKASLSSGLLLFIAFYCHIEGLKHTTIAKNAFIVGSSVVFIPFILYFKNRVKTDTMTILQTLMAILGLGLITLVDIQGINKGDVITLVGTLVYAMYTIKVEESVRKFDTTVFTGLQLTTVGLLSLIAMILLEKPEFNFTPFEWTSLGFMALILTGAFYFLLNKIQQVLSASNVTLIFTMEPFFATLFGFLFLGELITSQVVIGGGLIMISMVLPYLIKTKERTGVYEH